MQQQQHILVYLFVFTDALIPLYIRRVPPCILIPSFSFSSWKAIAMERKRSKQQLALLWAALLSQCLFMPVMSALDFEDQKNFFHTDPNTSTPPTVYYTPPAYAHSTPTTPSHGGGTPPANCGTPPSGGHHHSSPSTPSSGYYHSPPSSNPRPPLTLTPPSITVPSPPYDPHSPPYTCTYWKNHPALIWGLFGWWGSVGSAFGVTNVPGVGANTNLLQALSNTRTDGFGELYREGTASLLNSMAHAKFPYTTTQVRDRFVGALSSNKAAAAQARVFKLANEGKIKSRV